MPAPRFQCGEVPTPSLVVERDTLQRNIDVMAMHGARAGIALRPHAKTHKCPQAAQLQVDAGAIGLSVATVGEAEVFAAHGIADLFIAYPLWADCDLGQRLSSLAERAVLAVGADSSVGVHRLHAHVRRPDAVRIVVEIDCGLHRSGTQPKDAALVARAALDAGFQLGGVFTFPGHSYAPGMRDRARADEEAALEVAAGSLESAGIPCTLRSGGSTPTASITGADVVSELRPGVYVFNDAQQLTLGTCTAAEIALAALATVVSAPSPERIVLDAGSKLLGPDRPSWMSGHGVLIEHPRARVTGLWEHHAVVDVSATDPDLRPRLGDQVAVAPNHVCTAVNLARELWIVSNGALVDRWDVAASRTNR